MRKLRFALLSVAFIALAIVAYALQAWSTLHQWLTGRPRGKKTQGDPDLP